MSQCLLGRTIDDPHVAAEKSFGKSTSFRCRGVFMPERLQ